jgi:uncharacterized membrane protein YkvI
VRDTIQTAIKSGHGVGILYAGLIGLALSDIIPTPADALYFYNQQRLKEKFTKKEITPDKYWFKEGANYYGLNLLWWLTVIGVVSITKGGLKKKASVGVGVIAAGAVIGVIALNIKKDEELQKRIQYQ